MPPKLSDVGMWMGEIAVAQEATVVQWLIVHDAGKATQQKSLQCSG